MAFTIHGARTSTSSGTEEKQSKFVGPILTMMKFLPQRDGDLSKYFDKIDGSEDGNNISSLKIFLLETKQKLTEEFYGGIYL